MNISNKSDTAVGMHVPKVFFVFVFLLRNEPNLTEINTHDALENLYKYMDIKCFTI